MGKNKKRTAVLDESHLILNTLPTSTAITSIVDTHTHLLSTFEEYHKKYPKRAYDTIYKFTCMVITGQNVNAIIDVYYEAPVQKA